MLRIVREGEDQSAATLRLEGKLLAPWVEEVRAEFERTSQHQGNVRLDLSAVSFADAAGLRLLRRLLGEGAQVASCSGYLAEVLRREDMS